MAKKLMYVCLVVLLVTVASLITACMDETPDTVEACYYNGFSAYVTPDTAYVYLELDPSWDVPDSAELVSPMGDLLPGKMYQVEGPGKPVLYVFAAAETLVSGLYRFVAFYESEQRTFEEVVNVRSDVVNYDFATVWPPVGSSDVGLTPTMRWEGLPGMRCLTWIDTERLPTHITVSWDEWLDEDKYVFLVGGFEGCDELGIPPNLLAPNTKYFWRLWILQYPDCDDAFADPRSGYVYNRNVDNFLMFTGWFTTVSDSG